MLSTYERTRESVFAAIIRPEEVQGRATRASEAAETLRRLHYRARRRRILVGRIDLALVRRREQRRKEIARQLVRRGEGESFGGLVASKEVRLTSLP